MHDVYVLKLYIYTQFTKTLGDIHNSKQDCKRTMMGMEHACLVVWGEWSSGSPTYYMQCKLREQDMILFLERNSYLWFLARIKDERNSDRGENGTRRMGVTDPFCLFPVVVQAMYARAISI